MPTIRLIANSRAARFLICALFAVALAGCSKCDVPAWWHGSAPPQSCHDQATPH
jgi:hypothetical protein